MQSKRNSHGKKGSAATRAPSPSGSFIKKSAEPKIPSKTTAPKSSRKSPIQVDQSGGVIYRARPPTKDDVDLVAQSVAAEPMPSLAGKSVLESDEKLRKLVMNQKRQAAGSSSMNFNSTVGAPPPSAMDSLDVQMQIQRQQGMNDESTVISALTMAASTTAQLVRATSSGSGTGDHSFTTVETPQSMCTLSPASPITHYHHQQQQQHLHHHHQQQQLQQFAAAGPSLSSSTAYTKNSSSISAPQQQQQQGGSMSRPLPVPPSLSPSAVAAATSLALSMGMGMGGVSAGHSAEYVKRMSSAELTSILSLVTGELESRSCAGDESFIGSVSGGGGGHTHSHAHTLAHASVSPTFSPSPSLPPPISVSMLTAEDAGKHQMQQQQQQQRKSVARTKSAGSEYGFSDHHQYLHHSLQHQQHQHQHHHYPHARSFAGSSAFGISSSRGSDAGTGTLSETAGGNGAAGSSPMYGKTSPSCETVEDMEVRNVFVRASLTMPSPPPISTTATNSSSSAAQPHDQQQHHFYPPSAGGTGSVTPSHAGTVASVVVAGGSGGSGSTTHRSRPRSAPNAYSPASASRNSSSSNNITSYPEAAGTHYSHHDHYHHSHQQHQQQQQQQQQQQLMHPGSPISHSMPAVAPHQLLSPRKESFSAPSPSMNGLFTGVSGPSSSSSPHGHTMSPSRVSGAGASFEKMFSARIPSAFTSSGTGAGTGSGSNAHTPDFSALHPSVSPLTALAIAGLQQQNQLRPIHSSSAGGVGAVIGNGGSYSNRTTNGSSNSNHAGAAAAVGSSSNSSTPPQHFYSSSSRPPSRASCPSRDEMIDPSSGGSFIPEGHGGGGNGGGSTPKVPKVNRIKADISQANRIGAQFGLSAVSEPFLGECVEGQAFAPTLHGLQPIRDGSNNNNINYNSSCNNIHPYSSNNSRGAGVNSVARFAPTSRSSGGGGRAGVSTTMTMPGLMHPSPSRATYSSNSYSGSSSHNSQQSLQSEDEDANSLVSNPHKDIHDGIVDGGNRAWGESGGLAAAGADDILSAATSISGDQSSSTSFSNSAEAISGGAARRIYRQGHGNNNNNNNGFPHVSPSCSGGGGGGGAVARELVVSPYTAFDDLSLGSHSHSLSSQRSAASKRRLSQQHAQQQLQQQVLLQKKRLSQEIQFEQEQQLQQQLHASAQNNGQLHGAELEHLQQQQQQQQGVGHST